MKLSRIAIAVAAVTTGSILTLVLVNQDTGPKPTTPVGQPGESPQLAIQEPLKTPGIYEDAPESVAQDVSLDLVTNLSNQQQTRPAGEKFALEFTHLMVETSQTIDSQKLVADLTSDELPEDVKDFMLTVSKKERDAGFGRRWITSMSSFIRSEPSGPGAKPDSLGVELAFHQELDALPDQVQLITVRVDLTWTDDHWSVANFTAGTLGPIKGPDPGLTVADYLEGPGWREIPGSAG